MSVTRQQHRVLRLELRERQLQDARDASKLTWVTTTSMFLVWKTYKLSFHHLPYSLSTRNPLGTMMACSDWPWGHTCSILSILLLSIIISILSVQTFEQHLMKDSCVVLLLSPKLHSLSHKLCLEMRHPCDLMSKINPGMDDLFVSVIICALISSLFFSLPPTDLYRDKSVRE